MVGLVLVAHSPEVVDGLRAMVAQAAPAVPVECAGGSARGSLGTSAPAVEAAVAAALAASGGDGVLVLLDLGSAGLAIEIALEGLDPADRALVRVSEAPLVEGAIVAAVAAAANAPLDAVVAAAEAPLPPKLLGPA